MEPPPGSGPRAPGAEPDGDWSVRGIAHRVRHGGLSAAEAVRTALAAVEVHDPALRAFREVWPERALRLAARVDEAVARGAAPPLAGVPLAVKAWGGTRSEAARRLVAAGCVPIGSTSVPDGSTPWQTWGGTDRGPTVNPWRADRVPGGSSAGSAVAVAAGMVPLATGGDSAGSLRIPAAWCGVLGMKPTNALLPTARGDGLGALGPLTRTAGDLALVLDVLFPGDGRFARALRARPRLSAVWSATLGFARTGPEIAGVAYRAARRMAAAGGIDLRDAPDVVLADPADAWRALRDGSDPAAEALRTANDRRLARVFDQVDLLLTPTVPYPPHGHAGPGGRMNVALTWAFNVSGHPALSVPAGFTGDELPVGLQLVAAPYLDHLLPAAASVLPPPDPRPSRRT
ncbi:amidase [Marinactinospora rubrisoli]|uniref:Amidase n=1 Tax=Marinactinospora rubrisoli TaxID=2715399 RepID=A0ABW2K9D8_9ACTN